MAVLRFYKATQQDYDAFYKIKSDHQNILWSGFEKAPNYDSLHKWFDSQIDGNTREIFMVTCDGEVCGFFYLIPADNQLFEVGGGYGVLAKYRGKGIGSFIMKNHVELARQLGYKISSDWVAESNIASNICFERAGFKRTNEKELRHIALMNKDVLFYKWVNVLR